MHRIFKPAFCMTGAISQDRRGVHCFTLDEKTHYPAVRRHCARGGALVFCSPLDGDKLS